MPSGKPDPNCPECKGKGEITLFTSSSACACVNRSNIINSSTIEKYQKTFVNNPYFDNDFKIKKIPPKYPEFKINALGKK